MTDKKDSTPVGKKPAAIIDLKATVVETRTVQPKADAPTVASPSVETRAAFAQNTSKPAETAKSAPATQAGTSVPPTQRVDTKVDQSPPPRSAAVAGTPVVSPAKPRGGFASHLLSGIVGGAVALLGATQLAPYLNLGTGTTTDQRVAELEQKLARATAPVDAAQGRLAKLEEAAQALASGQVRIATELRSVEEKAGKGSALPADAADKLARLEEQLAQMVTAAAANPGQAGRLPQLAQLTSKLAEVETSVATRTAQVKTELMQQMDQRFARTGEITETTRSNLSGRAQSVEQAVKVIADETAALRAGMDTVKLDLDRRFREAAKPADVQTAVASVATKVNALEANMQGVVKSEQERNTTAGNILLSLELANLKRALDRGGKYASELAAVKGLAGGKLDLGVLEAQQSTGVPSLATLGQELAGVAHAMLDAETEPASASVSDRLLSSVKSIVRVRKVDFAPGDTSTEATIARMEQALKEGRIGDVLDESKKLSPKAQVPATKWLDRIKSRAAIDTTLAGLDANLKTSLAGGAAPKKVQN